MRPWAVATIVVAQILQVLSLAPWLFALLASAMVFDSPGSDNNPGAWLFVLAVFSYPIWLVASGVLTWVLMRKGRTGWALTLTGVMTLPIVGFGVLVALS